MARDGSSSRPPAQVVGGQRRRLARRANAPRSNTMPVLNPRSATASLAGSTSSLVIADGEEGATVTNTNASASPLEISQSMSNISSHSGQPGDIAPDSGSLTPTSASSSMTLTDNNKKKHGFLDHFKFGSRSATDANPPPPQTPTKAAKLLGLSGRPAAVPNASQLQGDGASDVPNDEDATDTGSRFREEGLETDAPQTNANRRNKGKGKQWLGGLLSPRRSKRTDVQDDDFRLVADDFVHGRPAVIAKSPDEMEADFVNYRFPVNEDFQQKPLPPIREWQHVPQAPHQPAPPRRTRKKDGKSLQHLVPIQESSFDNMNAAYHEDAHNTKQSAIHQFIRDASTEGTHSGSYAEPSAAGRGTRYELEVEDLSSSEDDYKLSPADEDYHAHVRRAYEKDHSANGPNAAMWLRSPLQRVENCLLDVAESALEMHKGTMNVNDYGRVESIIDTYKDEDIHEEDHSVHRRTPVNLSKIQLKEPDTLHYHQPERAGQGRLLSSMEADLEAIKASLDKSDAVRAETDAIVASLKASHEKDKLEFEKMKASQLTPVPSNLIPAGLTCDECGDDVEGPDDDADLVSIRSSIDLDEEPTVHVARAMSVMRVTPGMVKLVDIPPNKRKAGGPRGGEVPPPPPPK